jgi:hypothetical protein
MIQDFVDRFIAKEKEIKDKFRLKHPDDYEEIVKIVVDSIYEKYGDPDKTRIHCVDDGDYQGTLLFIIGAEGYQPTDYWSVKVDYGSCSGCDTFESIRYPGDAISEQQVNGYWTLALHIVQRMKQV